MDLSAGAVVAGGHGYGHILCEKGAAIPSGIDFRLPHPRSRFDRRAGTGVHDRGWYLLRAGCGRSRDGRRRIRAAAVVFLGSAHGFSRRGRQTARRTAHVGPPHEGTLRGEEPEIDDAAHACADRRCFTHGAAAGEQHGPRRDSGAGRSNRRGAIAPYQFDGRNAGAADRASGDGRLAHAADYRGGNRHHQHDRSAWRQLRGRGADRPHGSRSDGLYPQDR